MPNHTEIQRFRETITQINLVSHPLYLIFIIYQTKKNPMKQTPMTESEINSKRDRQLDVSHAYLHYKYNPSDASWKKFITYAITNFLTDIEEDLSSIHELPNWLEWMMGQRDNKLPNKSSGSFYTALRDDEWMYNEENYKA